MAISVFDLFKIGIGPSSSHPLGPMRAALRFAKALRGNEQLAHTHSIKVELFGSLGATGKGHGSDKAVILGLAGADCSRPVRTLSPKATHQDNWWEMRAGWVMLSNII